MIYEYFGVIGHGLSSYLTRYDGGVLFYGTCVLEYLEVGETYERSYLSLTG